jgi:ATP adenylyltransferase
MVAPYRHVANWEELTEEELLEIMKLSQMMIRVLKRVMSPHGFNMGVNLGRVAGAGIEDHVHLHIVPRWNGDTNFMPVIADTKVIPESLEEAYRELKAAIEEMEKRD